LTLIRLPFSAQRAEACGTRADKLRRDECGDWAIFGNNGHIYAIPEGYQLMVGCDFEPRWKSARGWESAKKYLAFAKLTQDGGEEGALIFDRLPTLAEASAIRLVLGIPKRVELSPATLAGKRAWASTATRIKPALTPIPD
jgi:hypothetical protein